ncbi:hypothetical protein E3T26_06075 [Cryobacterium sp. TMT1-21]|uniref:Uncharacterized protein n=1 Tax=Cryobacterium shii TaxID=1259235 RepID=A0AAQ2C8X5_9MICO|nr:MULTISPECIES: hypothetical protein [Cryobacterium]TFC52208.1 hypothetical protein E3O49_02750 [Cryobacterium shii]TFC84761.1 hypothetical protein E3T24_10030 [Cryobacterium sp. TmT2-59]TFD14515.1 hypothetical protein E3T42_11700 [Cryobacterium sp. TMT4-10]TFD15666.1 hypothetical protein E3T26_06075 [Cryobacterium sp. TMT1-21]TFD18965.1 hypothetical protein E3T32_11325 [Cryobacterium sp. TMT2-23]
MKLTALATLTLVGALALSGCSTSLPETGSTPAASAATAAPTDGSCAGVSVVVDFGSLDAARITDCVDTGAAGTVAASEVMKSAGVTTEGTVEWGDQVVCRVNDRPAAAETIEIDGEAPFTEACQSMPAAAAYWALWVKPTADASWEYASEGLGSLKLEPGQSVGLVFTTGTETPTPGS